MSFSVKTDSHNLPAWRNSLEDYPWPSHFADVFGHKMHFINEGDGDPVLMVHGNPTWSYYYRSLVHHFSANYRAIAVDHIGCGMSDKPRQYNYCLEQHVANLVEFVAQLNLNRITLIVHDWGGPIGLGAALRDINRYRRFVLLNTGAFPPPYIPLRILICKTPVFGRLAVQGLNLFARAATTMATERPGGLPHGVKRGLLAPYDCWAHRQAIYRFIADIPLSSNQSTWKRLDEIESGIGQLARFPIKLIWGMKDWCFRAQCLERFRQLLPNADVCEIETAGHYVIEDATDQVIEEIERFIEKGSTK